MTPKGRTIARWSPSEAYLSEHDRIFGRKCKGCGCPLRREGENFLSCDNVGCEHSPMHPLPDGLEGARSASSSKDDAQD